MKPSYQKKMERDTEQRFALLKSSPDKWLQKEINRWKRTSPAFNSKASIPVLTNNDIILMIYEEVLKIRKSIQLSDKSCRSLRK